jgi:hypothetical protein
MKKHIYNVSMFLIAPFIGLVYAVTFPILATGLLWVMGVNALIKKAETMELKKTQDAKLSELHT